MAVYYRIVPELRVAYVRVAGKITVEEIMIEGGEMFAEKEWVNGYHILCDYREVLDLNLTTEDLNRIVVQDKSNELLFNKSKCAIVAGNDFVYGISRMWEALSESTQIQTMVFKNMKDSLLWLNIEEHVFLSNTD